MAEDGRTIAQFTEVLIASLPLYIEKSLAAAGEDLASDIIARTFPSRAGEGIDANGQPIKQGRTYTAAYAKKRQDNKLQAAYIDFQFEGDLKRSVKQLAIKDEYRIDFSTDEQATKARGLEDRYNQQIWFASEEETNKAFDTFEGFFFRQVNDLGRQFGFK